jgi:hypothetical protein
MTSHIMMVRWEQYEIWISTNDKWHMAAAFVDLDLAKAISGNYSSNMRLIHAVYEGNKCVQKDTLMELGATRKSA